MSFIHFHDVMNEVPYRPVMSRGISLNGAFLRGHQWLSAEGPYIGFSLNVHQTPPGLSVFLEVARSMPCRSGAFKYQKAKENRPCTGFHISRMTN